MITLARKDDMRCLPFPTGIVVLCLLGHESAHFVRRTQLSIVAYLASTFRKNVAKESSKVPFGL
jgi:hypothetical protein